ncbi:hypothetical protein C8F04DRAFT_1275128 [Mycena alexandri]|uniref:Uncharacterized protein n=1 Tax=Mycena alexandri TaxID=1745969 RepID=A0AAD6S792_9AGAR|nr:hypothetical protein C8F04DRAFT_1275128 [Mycena alexandri]
MLYKILVENVYCRLLHRLNASSALILGASVLGEDFVHAWRSRRVDGSGDSIYVLPNRGVFHPVIVGTVASADFTSSGAFAFTLRIPPHATPAMQALFYQQISCLASVVAARDGVNPDVRCEDTISWNYGTTSEDGSIHIVASDSTPVVLRTPGSCLQERARSRSTSSVCSTSSSSTMSSTDECVPAAPLIKTGDLLVVRCQMTCREFPRPNSLVVRLFELSAIDVAVIV